MRVAPIPPPPNFSSTFSMEKATLQMTMISSSSSSEPFPPDLLFSILAILPVKSLLRFRSLSKSYSHLISTRSFALLHQPFLPPESGLLITCPAKLQSAQHFYVAGLNGGAATLRLTVPPRFSRYTTQSVNGVVCLDFGITATICNPTTSKAVALPHICPQNSPASSSTSFCVNFFGFDPINSEYKVLNSWANFLTGKVEYRVFVLATNTWRVLNSGGPPIYAQRESLCFAGIIFFRGCINVVGTAQLVCLNLNSESFRVINLPAGAPGSAETSCLVQLKGVLGIVDYKTSELFFCVWILKDYDEEIWERRLIVKPLCPEISFCGHKFVVVGSTEAGEIMVVSPCLSPPLIVFYLDITTRSFRRVMITGLPDYDPFDLSSNVVYVTNYVENILPL